VKRTKKSAAPKAKRSPKLPDELLPIVDAVVEVVFERMRRAATAEDAVNRPPLRRKTAKLNLPLPKQRTALAEALADLLLADLARRPRAKKKPKPTRRAVVSSRRATPRRVKPRRV